ncbi:hypothetical protein [Novosphingobium resinovorum]|uniref:hypothetical protein n=1 Tax=Novosphingobium resinovorum TaxID=158500 RepID=UPI002ED543BB|nr:hypothetical protein [Novosphingobium resinovorum]
MKTLLLSTLGGPTPLLPAVDLIPLSIQQLPPPSAPADIASLRSAVENVSDGPDAFLLVVGSDHGHQGAGTSPWACGIEIMRQAFGLITGAGRYCRERGAGTIVVALPASSLVASGMSTPDLVTFRSLIGLCEALRAELQDGDVRVGLFFYPLPEEERAEHCAARLTELLATGAMYSLSHDITAAKINAYFAPMIGAVENTSAGTPLPDIGPMAAVYDLHAAHAPSP